MRINNNKLSRIQQCFKGATHLPGTLTLEWEGGSAFFGKLINVTQEIH